VRGPLFDAHPELGVVWGLVQRFHVIFCAETEEAANEAVSELADAYQAAGINLGSAITSFCRWGPESLNFHAAGRATNAASEGANGKIEVLERMAYGVQVESQLRRPRPACLLRSPASAVASMMSAWHDDRDQFMSLDHPVSRRTDSLHRESRRTAMQFGRKDIT
jgi:hypothetical protein